MSEIRIVQLKWTDVRQLCRSLVPLLSGKGIPVQKGVYGIPTGGSFIARELSAILACPMLDDIQSGCLVVDDIVDSGATIEKYRPYASAVASLMVHERAPAVVRENVIHVQEATEWVEFPWEKNHPRMQGKGGPQDSIIRILEFIGEDPNRDGLQETPARVLNSFREMTAGMRLESAEILAKTFPADGYDELIVLRGIEFSSLCEHHLLPFSGTVDIGYLPYKVIVGISKLPRLVECLSKRLQLQERMTQDIAHSINQSLSPRGVGVVVRAQHGCMGCRGVRQRHTEMVTSTLLGYFREKPELRAEFLQLTR